MQFFKIPRKERIELMKKDKKDLDFVDKIKRRELEGAIRYRLTEKVIISLVALIMLALGATKATPMCEITAVPSAIFFLLCGLWMV